MEDETERSDGDQSLAPPPNPPQPGEGVDANPLPRCGGGPRGGGRAPRCFEAHDSERPIFEALLYPHRSCQRGFFILTIGTVVIVAALWRAVPGARRLADLRLPRRGMAAVLVAAAHPLPRRPPGRAHPPLSRPPGAAADRSQGPRRRVHASSPIGCRSCCTSAASKIRPCCCARTGAAVEIGAFLGARRAAAIRRRTSTRPRPLAQRVN